MIVQRLSPDLSGCALGTAMLRERSAGEALIRVRAASLNYPDLLMTRGEYQFKPKPPYIAGMELAGDVVDAGVDGAFRPGQRVMGGAKIGAYAEYALVPVESLRSIPDGLDYPQAAAMGAAYHTAWVALVELGGLEPGQTVLVHGAGGGVGMAACDLARALGARVIAATHDERKLDLIRAAVRPDAIVLNTGRFRDDVAALTEGRLCDLVFDPIGGDVFDESTRCVTFGGKLLVIGFVSGRIPEIAVNIPLIKGFSIVGVRAGEFSRRFPDRAIHIAAKIDRLASAGAIVPHIDRILSLDRWREGFEAMQRGDAVGKIVFRVDD